MRINTASIIVIALIFSATALQAQDSTFFKPQAATYLWPTNASNALSGTFGETRSSHFHAALDIKTWGQRGYPVYATRSGTLHRMAIGPTGYGKVLYLKHDDGSYSVYAHLLRFNEKLQQMADSIRFRDYSSSFDVVMDSLDIRIEQGEEIALSGASGIGPPHLHFELRTPDEDPFNPLLTNLDIRDTIAPSFAGLAVEPLAITSKIEGRNRFYTRKPRRGSAFADFGTINVQGAVGLAVDVFDQANGVPNVYAAYTLRMEVDGQTVFQSKADRFSYAETDQMHLDRIYTLLEQTGNAYQRLFVADGNTLPFYELSGNKGRLDLSVGRHKVEITATDYYGNRRRARVMLNVQPATAEPALLQEQFSATGGASVDPNKWQWFNDWVNIPVKDFQQLTLAPLINTPVQPVFRDNKESVSVNLKNSFQFYFRISDSHHFVARRIYPNEVAYLTASGSTAYSYFPAGTVYDTVSVAMSIRTITPDSVELKLLPDTIPVRSDFSLSVRLDSMQQADSTLSFYKTDSSHKRVYNVSTKRKGDFLTASAPSLGTYLILADHEPPELGRARITKTAAGQWVVYIQAKDRRSGIDYEQTEIYVNGQRGITEYEPESRRLVYYHPDFEPQSQNTLKIIAFDYAGNSAVKEETLSRQR